MSRDFLKEIVAHKKSLVEERRDYYLKLKTNIESTTYSQYGLFKKVLTETDEISLIAEIKKASPSKGIIREQFDVEQIAGIYRDHGAAAISVLTEEKYFLGKSAYLKKAVEVSGRPVLMKDFIVDADQLYEAFYLGASAVLLIVAILSDDQIKKYKALAKTMDMDCLVEVHNGDELKRALDCGAEIVGVNNRNLTTFDVDLSVSETLILQLPKGVVSVAESGLNTHDDIVRVQQAGADAVLIGETFMREQNIAQKVKEVMYG